MARKNLCPYKDGEDNLGKKGKAWGNTHTKNLYVTGEAEVQTLEVQKLTVGSEAEVQTLTVGGEAEVQTLTVGGEATIPNYIKDVTNESGLIKAIKGNGSKISILTNESLWSLLHSKGENPDLPTTNDALNALGVFMSYFNQKNKIANQPTQYGQLLNIPANKSQEACQLWVERPNGRMYHRGGNGSIAVNDTPFKRFLDTDDLSAAGVVAGDVSNANAWWVKLGGTIPLIIQGGIGGSSFVYPLSLSKVLTVAFSLNSGVFSYNWYTQDSKVNISNTVVSNPKGFPYNWLVIGIV